MVPWGGYFLITWPARVKQKKNDPSKSKVFTASVTFESVELRSAPDFIPVGTILCHISNHGAQLPLVHPTHIRVYPSAMAGPPGDGDAAVPCKPSSQQRAVHRPHAPALPEALHAAVWAICIQEMRKVLEGRAAAAWVCPGSGSLPRAAATHSTHAHAATAHQPVLPTRPCACAHCKTHNQQTLLQRKACEAPSPAAAAVWQRLWSQALGLQRWVARTAPARQRGDTALSGDPFACANACSRVVAAAWQALRQEAGWGRRAAPLRFRSRRRPTQPDPDAAEDTCDATPLAVDVVTRQQSPESQDMPAAPPGT